MAPQSDIKNIIVLGLTQNGKSSFIESVLNYAGSKPLTPHRPAMGRGTHSETKNVSKYPVYVNIKQFTTNRNGKRVDITHDSLGSVVTKEYDENGEYTRRDEPLEWIVRTHPTTKKRYKVAQEFKQSPWDRLEGLEPQEPTDSGYTLRLNMIDTPGLSDSAGIKKQIEEFRRSGMSAAEAEKAAFNASRNLVDESHRLKIIKAVAKTTAIHGVCLVIQRTKVFGDELAKLKLFVEMFKDTGLAISYYIIHTKFTNTTMFQASGLSRIQESEEFFGIQAKHYFINNKPDRTGDEPLSAHFADQELSDFFFHISESSGVKMRDIKFRKTDTSIDEALSSSLTTYIASLNGEDKDIQDNLKYIDAEILRSESKIESYNKEIEKWKSQRRDLDTYDHVQIDKRESWVDSSFWDQWPSCEFDMSTNVLIRSVDRSNTDGRGDWISESGSNYGVGTKHCRARFKAFWNRKAGGIIKVYGWKKDVKADDIKTLDEDCDRVGRLKSSEEGDLNSNKQKRDAAKARRVDITREIESLKHSIRDPIGLDYISLSNLSDSGHYLLTNDIYCVAEGYNFKTKVPAKLLPKFEFDEQKVQLELREQGRKHQQMELLCRSTVKFLDEDLGEKCQLLARLTKIKHIATSLLGSAGSVSMPKELVLLRSSEPNHTDLLKIGADLLPHLKKTYAKIHAHQDSIETNMATRSKHLRKLWTTALEEISPIITRLEESIGTVETNIDEWQLKITLHTFSQAAVEEVLNKHIKATEYNVGAFTVLKRAIEKGWNDKTAPPPFIQLYRSIAYQKLIHSTATSSTPDEEVNWNDDVWSQAVASGILKAEQGEKI
ncbi:hypothetical protein TWF694_004685 [Orbilia ellipsospora]|uniref:G domain-containing protein n=1 Tax=Orbilia ellipsospora TaxID=2528407 RepID=A0AAV9WVU4_9PEZI